MESLLCCIVSNRGLFFNQAVKDYNLLSVTVFGISGGLVMNIFPEVDCYASKHPGRLLLSHFRVESVVLSSCVAAFSGRERGHSSVLQLFHW